MESIYEQIDAALSANLYFLAISATVSLPDICATLATGKHTTALEYKEWFRENASHLFKNFGEDECYEVRCGVVHSARMMGGKHKYSRYDRVLFVPPGSRMTFHDSVLGNRDGPGECAVMMDAAKFCRAMIGAARAWEKTQAGNDAFRASLDKVVRVRSKGLDPFISGFPVIA